MTVGFRSKGKVCICEECGKPFEKKTPTQKYCSDECRIEVCRKQTRLYKGIKGKLKKKKTYNTGVKKKKHRKGMWAIWE